MKRFIWVALIAIAISSIAGCARSSRLANDIDWVVFDGEPSREN